MTVEVVAEIGANHGGDVDLAHRMIEALNGQGCRLVKFQIYDSSELVADRDRSVSWGPTGTQTSGTVGELFDSVSLPRAAFAELFSHARELGMEPFATPFSLRGVEELHGLGVRRLKIASSDVTYDGLLRACAATHLPIILSVGKSTLAEADNAVHVLEDSGCEDLTLLHAVSAYPTPIEDTNLRNIPLLATAFPEHRVGFSDHTEGAVAAIAATAMGAVMVEKHVTMDARLTGPDNWFSLPIEVFRSFQSQIWDAQRALGSTRKRITSSEESGRRWGTRSAVAARNINANTILSQDDIAVLRPGTGISPEFEGVLPGMRVLRSVAQGEPFQWEMFRL